MPGTVPNGPFAPDRMNATAHAPTESKRRKPAGPIVVLSILGLTFLSFAGLMGLIWVNDMGIIGIMRLSTIWIAAVCIVMGLVVIILGFRGRRTGGLIPLGLVAGGCALCMTIVSGTYGVYYRDLGASGINTVVSLSQSVSARNSDGMNDVQKDGIFVADASDATFETLQQGVAFSGENYNTDQAIIDWSDWDKTHGPHTVKMLDGKTSISNCPVGTITIAATQAQVHIVLPDSCTYAFGTADSYYSTSSDVGGKYEMVYNNYMGPSFVFFEAESATNGPDHEWLYKESAMPDNGPELKINIPYVVEARVNVVYASRLGRLYVPAACRYIRRQQYKQEHNRTIGMIKPLQLGDGIMTDETKEFASIEDATPTTAIPSETDATTATTTMVTVDDRTDTTVLPSAADDDETAVLPVPDNHADASVSDVDTQATAASPSPIEPTTNRIAQETVADAVEGDGGPVPSADDVPMYAASSARPPYEQSQTAGKPCQPGGSAKNVQNAKDVQNAKNIQKQSTSAPTVVFGLLGVIIGVIALVFGYISPDRMISLFSPNPQLLTAIICAVVGLILVIVAVVWAIVGAVKKRK